MEEPGGRALDAAIARHVFGFEVEERTDPHTQEREFVQRMPSGLDWVRVAYYSETLAAAITVEVALERRGWRRVTGRNIPGAPTVVLEHRDGRVVQASGPLNLALCLAALKAVSSAD